MFAFLRVGYLWAVLVALTLITTYTALSRDSVALFASHALGEEAVAMAQRHGALGLYVAAVVKGAVGAIPMIFAGVALGLLCRAAGIVRALRRRRANAGIHLLTDRFGGRLVMHHAALEHDPDVREFEAKDRDVERLPPGTSAIERDALALLAAYPEVPAEVSEPRGPGLAEQAFKAWKLACDRHGAASLEAQVAICRELGKVRAYGKDASGTWRVRGMHRQLSLQLVRDLDGYLEAPEATRRELMEVLTALQTHCIPVDLTARQRAILRAAQRLERQAAAEETRLEEAALGPEQLAALLHTTLPALWARLNINRQRNASAPADGFFLPDKGTLLIPEQALRARIAELLPAEWVTALKLKENHGGQAHPASGVIIQTARLLFDTFAVFDDKPATEGVFKIRSGTRMFNNVLVIKAASIPEQFTQAWGKNRHEIDIL